MDEPRLAAIYDALDPDRSDLVAYLDMVEEFGARSVLDLGCGTGVFALMLADRGITVIGVDPAGASLDVARAKPGAERVTWIHGDASAIPSSVAVDAVTMTANVAQVFVTDAEWSSMLAAVHGALRPGGRLTFETRVPARRAWEDWTDGEVITSRSTLRFRSRADVEASLTAAGFVVDEVRDAPDRPGRELVFVALRVHCAAEVDQVS